LPFPVRAQADRIVTFEAWLSLIYASAIRYAGGVGGS
jgi:hypothetical protein